jgi:protein phosphatase
MTTPDHAPLDAYSQPGRGAPPQIAPQIALPNPWAPNAGAPVPLTAMGAPGPTMNEAAPPANAPWSSGMYNGQPVQAGHGAQGPALAPPPPALGAYNMDAGVGALPLPPVSNRPGYGAPAPTHVPQAGPYGGASPTPYNSTPPSMTGPGVQPSRGGIVFVIIGLSAVVAVLILVVIWAIWLR